MNTILAAVAPHLVEGALTLFLLAGSWLAAQGARLFGAGSEQKAREALLGLVEMVANQARERVYRRMSDATVPADTEGREAMLARIALPIVAGSAEYVAQQMPGKMKALGVDKAGVERMLSLRLGLPAAVGEDLLRLWPADDAAPARHD